MTTDWLTLLAAALQGVTVVAVVLLAVFVVIMVTADVRKLRRRGRNGARSLDELVGDGRHSRFRPGTAPRGPVDQLRTPELDELANRKSR